MFQPHHFGLLFSKAHAENAQKHREEAPVESAWEFLNHYTPKSDFESAQMNGLRYRFNDDIQSGVLALDTLEKHTSESLDLTRKFTDVISETFVLVQSLELLRNHPDMTDSRLAHLLKKFSDTSNQLNQQGDKSDLSISQFLWLTALNMATSIALEDEASFDECVTRYQQTINNDLHPEGYLPRAIEGGTAHINFANQVASVQALILMAEMAKHVGVDLYAYQNRGVSVLTAATYPLYYYFYPEKWKWVEETYKGGRKVESEVLLEDDAKRIFREHAGFLEMLNLHYGNRPLKAVRMILDDLRPIYDIYGGGLTTLTHGFVEKKRRGLFG